MIEQVDNTEKLFSEGNIIDNRHKRNDTKKKKRTPKKQLSVDLDDEQDKSSKDSELGSFLDYTV